MRTRPALDDVDSTFDSIYDRLSDCSEALRAASDRLEPSHKGPDLLKGLDALESIRGDLGAWVDGLIEQERERRTNRSASVHTIVSARKVGATIIPFHRPKTLHSGREHPWLGDNEMTMAMLPNTVLTIRIALNQAEQLFNASIEHSPAERRYRALAERLEMALGEFGEGGERSCT